MQRVLKIIREMARPVKFGNAGGTKNPVIGGSILRKLTDKNPFGTRPFLERLSDRLAADHFEVEEITHHNPPSRIGSKRWYRLIARKEGVHIQIETPHSTALLKNAIRVQHRQI